MTARLRLWFTSLLGVLALGCAGYQLGPTQSLPYHSVAVLMFKNTTLKPQLEAQISNAIIKRFQRDGTLRIESAENADVVINGQITKFDRQELRAVRTDVNTRNWRTGFLTGHSRRPGRYIYRDRSSKR